MELLELILGFFERPRAVLSNASGSDGNLATFISSILVYTPLVLAGGLLLHGLMRAAAEATRGCARRLASNASLATVIRLESSSARVESALRWIGSRIVRTGIAQPKRRMFLPTLTPREHLTLRIGRWCLRKVWLIAWGIVAAVASVPRLARTGAGIAVLLASVLTAFPEEVQSVTGAVQEVLQIMSLPEATLTTILVAVIPLMLVVLRFLIRERTVTRRTFRRERHVAALHRLYQATPAIENLSHVFEDQMHETIRAFTVEKHHAQEWHAWAHRTDPPSRSSRYDQNDHIECDRSCLENRAAKSPDRVSTEEVRTAICEVELHWQYLRDYYRNFADLLPQRGWSGLVGLRFCFSGSGEFRAHKVPAHDEWRRRRISWQHGQLTWADITAEDEAAGRSVSVELTQSPKEAWLEEELQDLVWDLAELSRELRDLAHAAHDLLRPRRIERLAQLAES